MSQRSAPAPSVAVGLDVLGGRFAANGGGLPGDPGRVYYFAPDRLAWEPLGVGHGRLGEWAEQLRHLPPGQSCRLRIDP